MLVHLSRRQYLRFTLRSAAYDFQVLPFGLSLAPPDIHQVLEGCLGTDDIPDCEEEESTSGNEERQVTGKRSLGFRVRRNAAEFPLSAASWQLDRQHL
ncbi:hypothetical protein AAFF_G00181180 [Aldrovandia affinis]|uniref:Uncharacterized protein n=1 Tax=Aldrovandia affinis TaxID=143900 RepID=A0AAD7SYJ9_9TELE|nr:hypothetical protein AAFF_G00181180 [Aldrovandia affinis]